MSKTKISRFEFGWWYVRYCFVFHPYAAFDVFCEEYKKQNNYREAVREEYQKVPPAATIKINEVGSPEEYNDDEFDSP